MMRVNIILFVKDQEISTRFYEKVFLKKPTLNVPGMTEFEISKQCVLGLMPENGIKNILKDKIHDPEESNGISRCELYLTIENPELYIRNVVEAGGELISPYQKRSWGDNAGYVKDSDGHIIAFAMKI
jgi:uncharacterized glyoxalase superfamily protein PhnB